MKMKYLLLIFIVNACGTADPRFLSKNFYFSEEKTVNVGDAMISVEAGIKTVFLYLTEINAIRQELIYGGIDHNVIQVDYREYEINKRGTFIRDAYRQSMKYDLNETHTIKYRTITIDVVSANSSSITFIVRSFGINPEYNGVQWDNK